MTCYCLLFSLSSHSSRPKLLLLIISLTFCVSGSYITLLIISRSYFLCFWILHYFTHIISFLPPVFLDPTSLYSSYLVLTSCVSGSYITLLIISRSYLLCFWIVHYFTHHISFLPPVFLDCALLYSSYLVLTFCVSGSCITLLVISRSYLLCFWILHYFTHHISFLPSVFLDPTLLYSSYLILTSCVSGSCITLLIISRSYLLCFWIVHYFTHHISFLPSVFLDRALLYASYLVLTSCVSGSYITLLIISHSYLLCFWIVHYFTHHISFLPSVFLDPTLLYSYYLILTSCVSGSYITLLIISCSYLLCFWILHYFTHHISFLPPVFLDCALLYSSYLVLTSCVSGLCITLLIISRSYLLCFWIVHYFTCHITFLPPVFLDPTLLYSSYLVLTFCVSGSYITLLIISHSYLLCFWIVHYFTHHISFLPPVFLDRALLYSSYLVLTFCVSGSCITLRIISRSYLLCFWILHYFTHHISFLPSVFLDRALLYSSYLILTFCVSGSYITLLIISRSYLLCFWILHYFTRHISFLPSVFLDPTLLYSYYLVLTLCVSGSYITLLIISCSYLLCSGSYITLLIISRSYLLCFWILHYFTHHISFLPSVFLDPTLLNSSYLVLTFCVSGSCITLLTISRSYLLCFWIVHYFTHHISFLPPVFLDRALLYSSYLVLTLCVSGSYITLLIISRSYLLCFWILHYFTHHISFLPPVFLDRALLYSSYLVLTPCVSGLCITLLIISRSYLLCFWILHYFTHHISFLTCFSGSYITLLVISRSYLLCFWILHYFTHHISFLPPVFLDPTLLYSSYLVLTFCVSGSCITLLIISRSYLLCFWILHYFTHHISFLPPVFLDRALLYSSYLVLTSCVSGSCITLLIISRSYLLCFWILHYFTHHISFLPSVFLDPTLLYSSYLILTFCVSGSCITLLIISRSYLLCFWILHYFTHHISFLPSVFLDRALLYSSYLVLTFCVSGSYITLLIISRSYLLCFWIVHYFTHHISFLPPVFLDPTLLYSSYLVLTSCVSGSYITLLIISCSYLLCFWILHYFTHHISFLPPVFLDPTLLYSSYLVLNFCVSGSYITLLVISRSYLLCFWILHYFTHHISFLPPVFLDPTLLYSSYLVLTFCVSGSVHYFTHHISFLTSVFLDPTLLYSSYLVLTVCVSGSYITLLIISRSYLLCFWIVHYFTHHISFLPPVFLDCALLYSSYLVLTFCVSGSYITLFHLLVSSAHQPLISLTFWVSGSCVLMSLGRTMIMMKGSTIISTWNRNKKMMMMMWWWWRCDEDEHKQKDEEDD